MRDQIVRRAPAVVMLPGEIDVSNAQQVFDQLSSAFAAGATVVIADLTKTVFCDSTGLGTLLRVQRLAAADGAQLRLG
jgi:anti-sigma B factor antagonist